MPSLLSTVEMKQAPATTGKALVQGTLDMLVLGVLGVLALEPMHGYGVTQRIEQISRGTFEVLPGHRLAPRARYGYVTVRL